MAAYRNASIDLHCLVDATRVGFPGRLPRGIIGHNDNPTARPRADPRTWWDEDHAETSHRLLRRHLERPERQDAHPLDLRALPARGRRPAAAGGEVRCRRR